MKKIFLLGAMVYALGMMTACKSGLKVIKPSLIVSLPTNIDFMEVMDIWELIDTVPYDKMSDHQRMIVDTCESNGVLMHFYSPACSWYCGGIIDTVISSSCQEADTCSYEGINTHDWSIHSAWVTRPNDYGVGESLTYFFPGNCPRITTVCILNGYTRDTNEWQDYSRVKRLKVYYDGKPYAILELQDTRGEQEFDVGLLGYRDVENHSEWSLKFEILEVYPGRKHQNTAITELYFDGVDVH